MSHHWMHLTHAASHAKGKSENIIAGLLLIVFGFFLTPMLIGVPMIIYGIYKLCTADGGKH